MSINYCGMCNRISKYMNGEEDYKAVYESEHSLAIYPSKPSTQVHILIMTKRHFETVFDITDEHDEVMLDIMKAIQAASREVIALKGACKVQMYLGEFQNTRHFHCHIVYDESIDQV